MPAILGIDAAWTESHPSGVALVQDNGARWKCIAVAPSYAAFIAAGKGSRINWESKPELGAPDADRLLDAALSMLNGAQVDLVTVDMPLATERIEGRRVADNELSRAFGAKGCAVHTPSAKRPGRIADELRAALARARPRAYPLATKNFLCGTTPALVEVYPHTSLLALLSRPYRVPYKISRFGREALKEWPTILARLGETIEGISLRIPSLDSIAYLKRYEDALDALVCAWTGIEYLAGRAKPYGNETAAIWTP